MAARRISLGVLLAAVCSGCISTVSYGPVPPLPDVHDDASRCYARGRLALGEGRVGGKVVTSLGISTNSVGTSGPPVSVNAAGAASHGADHQGVVFYRGEERLAPRQGLELLGLPGPLQRYDAGVEQVSGGRVRHWARPLWMSLAIAGAAGIIAGAGLALSVSPDPETGKSDFTLPLVVLGGSVGVLLLSLPFIPLDLGRQEESIEYDARQALLLEDAKGGAEVDQGVEAYNRALEQRCGAR